MTACTATVFYGPVGPLAEPRRCRQRAREGSALCGLHAKRAQGTIVTTTDAGFCLVCAAAARSYLVEGTRIALCDEHGKALARAISANANNHGQAFGRGFARRVGEKP